MINKYFRNGLVLGIIFLFLCAGAVSGLNIDIKNSGTPANYNGNLYTVDDEGDGDFTTITDAIINANDGDIIEVYSGVYFDHNIIVDKSVEINGIDSELGSGGDTGNPVINLYDQKIGFVLLADSISISNFNITNIKLDLVPGNSGAILIKSNSNNINNNIFYTDPLGEYQGICIYINVSNNNKISNNYFYNTFYAINVFVGENNNISYNHFLGENALLLIGSNKNTIYANEFSSCIIGILFEALCNENIVSYNNFNFEGMVLFISWSNSNVIEYNNFINNGKTTTFVSSHKTRWYGNYWGTPSIGIPKIIWGINLYILPWINIDWHPAKEPNTP